MSGATIAEYLSGELNAKNKHELIDGDIYAMAGLVKHITL